MDVFLEIHQGNAEAVRTFIADGGDPNLKNEDGYSVLHWAALMNQKELCRMLKEAGAKTDVFIETALGNVETVSRYIENGIDINAANEHGHRLLMTAAHTGQQEVVRLFIESGAEVNARHEKSGNTALIAAAHQGNTEMVHYLLEAGADKTLQNKTGGTAREIAEQAGFMKVVELLK